MSKRSRLVICFALSCALGACSLPELARAPEMVPPSAQSSPVDSPFYKSITLGLVNGRGKNPAAEAEIGATEFKEALNTALSKFDYLSAMPRDAKYVLDAFIIQTDQRNAGTNFTVDAFVRYKLTTSSGKRVIQEIIMSSAPGTTGEILAGGQEFQERVMRENIANLLKRLGTLTKSQSG